MMTEGDKEHQRWVSLKDIDSVLHKNNCLYWQWMASHFGQPKTLTFLEEEFTSLQAIRDEMKVGDL